MAINMKQSENVKKIILITILILPIVIFLYFLFSNLNSSNALTNIRTIVLPVLCFLYYLAISAIIIIRKYKQSKKSNTDKTLLWLRIAFWLILLPITIPQIIMLISVFVFIQHCVGSQCSAADIILLFPFTIVCIVLSSMAVANILAIKQQQKKKTHH